MWLSHSTWDEIAPKAALQTRRPVNYSGGSGRRRYFLFAGPRRTRQILLDPDRLLNRLSADLILVLLRVLVSSIDRDK
jgi:hypothetical protein